MELAILGSGYVADFYMATLPNYSELQIAGAYDIDPERHQAFAAHYRVKAYRDFDALLGDQSVQLVLNLTNPRSHFETTKACLEAGKHVYSEKPVAMDSEAAATPHLTQRPNPLASQPANGRPYRWSDKWIASELPLKIRPSTGTLTRQEPQEDRYERQTDSHHAGIYRLLAVRVQR